MVVGAIGARTDVAIIGAGPGGYVAALRAADVGLDVTLIEASHLGGTCLNVGCIPSKALIEVANARFAATAMPGLSAHIDVDMAAISDHLATTSATLRAGVKTLLAKADVTVLSGTANFSRHDRLIIEHPPVDGREAMASHLEFDHAIVATGSRPIELANLPFSERVIDSTAALRLDQLPDRAVIVGGGYVGVELGTALAKLGSTVSIVEATSQLLPATPAILRRAVTKRLDELGVTVLTNTLAGGPDPRGLVSADGALIEADLIIVAVGRRPSGDRCSIDRAGASLTPSGHVIVDERLSAAPGIYAIGDVIEGPALAHRASSDAERVVASISGQSPIPPTAIPAVIYSDPEIMSVGIEPDQARAAGLSVHRFAHRASARALTTGNADGVTVVIADEAGTIVGVHCVGPHASELAGEATLAIEMAATLDDLALTVHPHPTMSETIAEAAWLALGHPLHVRR